MTKSEMISMPQALAADPFVSRWIRLEPDGVVTAMTGKVELGQGIVTTFSQIVAEEMDVAVDTVHIVTAATDRSPDEGFTSGSRSTEEGGTCLRLSAATLRRHLLDLAARQLKVQPHQLAVHDGRITAPSGDDAISYAELAHAVDSNLQVTDKTETKLRDAYLVVGTNVPRIDLRSKVLGEPAYVQDMRLTGMVFGRVVRPATQPQTLAEVDREGAEELPGVVTVVRDGNFLGVVAEREEQAIAAMLYLQRTARWSGDPHIHDPDPTALLDRLSIDDVAVSRSGPTPAQGYRTHLEASYTRMPLAHAALGPSSAVAQWDGDRVKVWTHSQGVFPLREEIASVVNIPLTDVTVIHVEGAGCYGHNGADDAALDAVLLAKAVPGRPVKLQWSRRQEFLWEPYGSAMLVRIRAGLDAHGRIADWRQEVWSHSHMARPGHPSGVRLLAGVEVDRDLPISIPDDPPLPTSGILRNAVPLYNVGDLEVTPPGA